MGIKKTFAFTLIEVMVVIGVIAITLPALFSIVFLIMRQHTKVIRLQEVKKQGDYVLGLIKTEIRNSAVSIHSGEPLTDANKICLTTTEETAKYFKDRNGNWFAFNVPLNSIKVASESAVGATYLTNDKVYVSNFTITCYKPSDFSSALINIRFDICYNNGMECTSLRSEENVKMIYQTKIKLRSIDF